MQRLRPGATDLEPFWTNKPPSAFAVAGWDDGNQGALLSVWDWGNDDALHTTVWAVDADGHGQRLACDPLVMSDARVAAVSPDAIFLVVTADSSYWQLVRVPKSAKLP